jgi:hypothetical protein
MENPSAGAAVHSFCLVDLVASNADFKRSVQKIPPRVQMLHCSVLSSSLSVTIS